MYTLKFLPHEREISVQEGTTLLRAAMDAGVHINASCGGNGVCGKCRVLIEQGQVEGGINENLTQEDVDKGYRLACQAEIKGDIQVRVPVESEVDASVLSLQATPRKTANIRQVDLQDFKEKGMFIPPVEKIYLELPPPTKEDNLSDVTRLIDFLKVKQEEHRLEVHLSVLRKITEVMRKQDFKITATLARPIREGGKSEITNLQAGDTTERNFAVALDVGTTTVYAQILDLNNGEVLSGSGDFNAQISYGEDIINRIVYAEKGNGLEELNSAVLKTVNNLLTKVVEQAGIECEDISTITIAGNTTMTQLLLKLNPRYIRRSPYVPSCTFFPPLKAQDLGIDIGDHVMTYVYPSISSYVGADIVSGIMGSLMYCTQEITLYLDVGTNAEVVIGNKDWMACAACSAGPAFEGGGMKFGVRAEKGAIEDFSLDPITLEPMILTIGGKRPIGICGSGLISTVAVMFEMGVLDHRGKFNMQLETSRLRMNDDICEYVLTWKEQAGIDRDITLQEPDVDNLIRAKGAIYSGIRTLMNEIGLSIDDLERIIIAGGFGSYIDLEKAMTIGLLPEMDPERITYVGNGSLMGTKISSLNNHLRKDVTEVSKKMTNFEFSETMSYMDNYVAALFLPHTDVDKFPTVTKRLQEKRDVILR